MQSSLVQNVSESNIPNVHPKIPTELSPVWSVHYEPQQLQMLVTHLSLCLRYHFYLCVCGVHVPH